MDNCLEFHLGRVYPASMVPRAVLRRACRQQYQTWCRTRLASVQMRQQHHNAWGRWIKTRAGGAVLIMRASETIEALISPIDDFFVEFVLTWERQSSRTLIRCPCQALEFTWSDLSLTLNVGIFAIAERSFTFSIAMKIFLIKIEDTHRWYLLI